MVARGEVWWYEHPERGRRPYLILTRSEVASIMTRVLAVPTTRTVRGIPTEVPLGRDDGMPVSCVLSLDNVRTIRRALCTEKITTLSPMKLQEVCAALRLATSC